MRNFRTEVGAIFAYDTAMDEELRGELQRMRALIAEDPQLRDRFDVNQR